MRKLKIMLIIIGFVCWIFVFVNLAKADQVSICIKECKADVMDLQQCIQDEKNYWRYDEISDSYFKVVCRDLIKHERLKCYSECKEEKRK
jgi:hypothetical protein